MSDKSDPDFTRGYRARLWVLRNVADWRIPNYIAGVFNRLGLLAAGGFLLGDTIDSINWPKGALLAVLLCALFTLFPSGPEIERDKLQKRVEKLSGRKGWTVLNGEETKSVSQILHGPSYGDAWLHAMTTLEKKFPEKDAK